MNLLRTGAYIVGVPLLMVLGWVALSYVVMLAGWALGVNGLDATPSLLLDYPGCSPGPPC